MKKLSFDQKVLKLADEMEGKNLRQEWSITRNALKKKYYMSTEELNRAFGEIGVAQAEANRRTDKLKLKAKKGAEVKAVIASKIIKERHDAADKAKKEAEPAKEKKLSKPELKKLYEEKFGNAPDSKLTIPLLRAALEI